MLKMVTCLFSCFETSQEIDTPFQNTWASRKFNRLWPRSSARRLISDVAKSSTEFHVASRTRSPQALIYIP